MTDKELISIVDAEAKKLWDEINTGHEYSIIDSYNQFYGICMEIAEMVQEEPHCDERQFDELSKLQEGIGQIAKAVYEHKGKENSTVEKIREILIENSFDRMKIRGEISKKEEPEPQFKVGDTIRSKHWHTAVHKITSMDDKSYRLDNGGKVDLSSQQLWELVEEPVSIDFEQELYKAFGQVKDFTLGMRIAKWFYDMGKNSQEPVSKDFEMALAEMIDNAQKNVIEPWVVAAQWKDELIELVKSEKPVSEKLEEAARRYAALQAGMKDAMTSEFYEEYPYSPNDVNAFKAGAEWQREQMLSEEKK